MSGPPGKWLQTQIIDDICTAIDGGAPTDTACWVAGIHPGTVRRWVLRVEKWHNAQGDNIDADEGELPDGLFDAVMAVKRARGKVELRLLARCEEGEPGWQGSAWVLERTQPTQYALGEHFRGRLADEDENDSQPARHEKLTGSDIDAALAAIGEDLAGTS
jgi:hypothetical protein